MSGLRIVVTGACGFIGLNLCRYLSDRGYCVTAVYRAPRHDDLRSQQFYQLDLNDFSATQAMLVES